MTDFFDESSEWAAASVNFSRVVDDACTRLWNKKAELSVRRIRLLEEDLVKLEKELDEFIAQRP